MPVSSHPVLLMHEIPMYLRAADVARHLGISKRAAYRLFETNAIPTARIGRSVRVRREALLDYLAAIEPTSNGNGDHAA